MNHNLKTVKRMKEASQSRKLVIYHTMKTALTAFSRMVSLYHVLNKSRREREKALKEAVREGFKSEGYVPPAGGVIHQEGPEFIVGRFTPRKLISQIEPANFEIRHEVIDDAAAWEKVKQRLSIPNIEQDGLYINSAADYAKRVEQTKKSIPFDPNDKVTPQEWAEMFIGNNPKTVKQPKTNDVIHFSGQAGGKTLKMRKYLNDCISTDCCGKCQKDKPE